MAILTADYHSVFVSDTYLHVIFSVINIFGYNYRKIACVRASCLVLAVTALGNM
jgi:hypothetical protein